MKAEPTYTIKKSQAQSLKNGGGRKKRKKRRGAIKDLYGSDLMSRHLFSSTY